MLKKEDILQNKQQELVKLYEHLESIIKSFGNCKIEVLKSSIQFRVPTTFCSVYFKKDFLLVEFALKEEFLQPPVFQTVRISGKRIYHRSSVHDLEDLNTNFIEKLKEAYYLIKNNY